MTFCNYPDVDQAHLAEAIRATAEQHQTTSLYLWRTALKQVNPQVITVTPYCMSSALVQVYDLLNAATEV